MNFNVSEDFYYYYYFLIYSSNLILNDSNIILTKLFQNTIHSFFLIEFIFLPNLFESNINVYPSNFVNWLFKYYNFTPKSILPFLNSFSKESFTTFFSNIYDCVESLEDLEATKLFILKCFNYKLPCTMDLVYLTRLCSPSLFTKEIFEYFNYNCTISSFNALNLPYYPPDSKLFFIIEDPFNYFPEPIIYDLIKLYSRHPRFKLANKLSNNKNIEIIKKDEFILSLIIAQNHPLSHCHYTVADFIIQNVQDPHKKIVDLMLLSDINYLSSFGEIIYSIDENDTFDFHRIFEYVLSNIDKLNENSKNCFHQFIFLVSEINDNFDYYKNRTFQNMILKGFFWDLYSLRDTKKPLKIFLPEIPEGLFELIQNPPKISNPFKYNEDIQYYIIVSFLLVKGVARFIFPFEFKNLTSEKYLYLYGITIKFPNLIKNYRKFNLSEKNIFLPLDQFINLKLPLSKENSYLFEISLNSFNLTSKCIIKSHPFIFSSLNLIKRIFDFGIINFSNSLINEIFIFCLHLIEIFNIKSKIAFKIIKKLRVLLRTIYFDYSLILLNGFLDNAISISKFHVLLNFDYKLFNNQIFIEFLNQSQNHPNYLLFISSIQLFSKLPLNYPQPQINYDLDNNSLLVFIKHLDFLKDNETLNLLMNNIKDPFVLFNLYSSKSISNNILYHNDDHILKIINSLENINFQLENSKWSYMFQNILYSLFIDDSILLSESMLKIYSRVNYFTFSKKWLIQTFSIDFQTNPELFVKTINELFLEIPLNNNYLIYRSNFQYHKISNYYINLLFSITKLFLKFKYFPILLFLSKSFINLFSNFNENQFQEIFNLILNNIKLPDEKFNHKSKEIIKCEFIYLLSFFYNILAIPKFQDIFMNFCNHNILLINIDQQIFFLYLIISFFYNFNTQYLILTILREFNWNEKLFIILKNSLINFEKFELVSLLIQIIILFEFSFKNNLINYEENLFSKYSIFKSRTCPIHILLNDHILYLSYITKHDIEQLEFYNNIEYSELNSSVSDFNKYYNKIKTNEIFELFNKEIPKFNLNNNQLLFLSSKPLWILNYFEGKTFEFLFSSHKNILYNIYEEIKDLKSILIKTSKEFLINEEFLWIYFKYSFISFEDFLKNEEIILLIIKMFINKFEKMSLYELNRSIKIIKLHSPKSIKDFLPKILELISQNIWNNSLRINYKIISLLHQSKLEIPNEFLFYINQMIISKIDYHNFLGFKSFSNLSKNQKDYFYIILENKFDQLLNNFNLENINPLFNCIIELCPEVCINRRNSLISIIKLLFLNFQKYNLSLIDDILFILAPQNTTTTTSLINADLLPSRLFDQFQDFWQIIEENRELITNYLNPEKDIDYYNSSRPFFYLSKYPDFIPYNIRHKLIFDSFDEELYSNYIYQIIKVTRETIFQDSINFLLKLEHINNKIDRLQVDFGESYPEDGGPLRNWADQFSEELIKKENNLFILSNDNSFFLPNLNEKNLNLFNAIGKFLGISVRIEATIKLSLPLFIWKQILNRNVSINDLKGYDDNLYNSLIWISENNSNDLDLDFSILNDNGEIIELIPNGKNILVNEENKNYYIELVSNYYLIEFYKDQIQSISKGFQQEMPLSLLSGLTSHEIQTIVEGSTFFDIEDFKKNLKINSNLNNKMINMFFNVIQNWNQNDLKNLLMFFTSSDRIPIGGFESFKIKNRPISLTVITNSNELPSSLTCSNRLYIPECKNEEELNQKLLYSINECKTFG